MQLSRGSALLTIRRLRSFLLLGAPMALLVLFAAACGEEPGVQPTSTEDGSQAEGAGFAITVYSSPT